MVWIRVVEKCLEICKIRIMSRWGVEACLHWGVFFLLVHLVICIFVYLNYLL